MTSAVARSNTALLAATGTVAGGMFLTTLPLSSIFTDWNWLWASVGCALPYLLVVSAFRYRGTASWWHSLLGLLVSAFMLLWVFVPQHLYLGVIPTSRSGTDISDLLHQAGQIMQADHAPLPSSPPLRLLVAAALVLLVALTDILGVLWRQPLLASAPLLEVLAVASATSSRSANPFWFAAAAIGFLLILLAGTRLQDVAWGPSVDGSAGRLGGGRRMAVTGILAALIVPILLPAVPTNLLARAAHHNGTGDGNGNGSGLLTLNSLASLRGSLKLTTPKNLFQVQVGTTDLPFYIRQEVDDRYDNNGWTPSGTTFGDPHQVSLAQGEFPVLPSETSPATVDKSNSFSMQATFSILNLGGQTLPILANPAKIRVDGNDGEWNSATSNVTNVNLKRNMVYTEDVQQPSPQVKDLEAAPAWDSAGNTDLEQRYRQLPKQPQSVTDLVNRLVGGLSTPYDKAKAISDYFTDGKNGFSYSLDATGGDTQSALVNFLQQKKGFCQQYAAAAAVLMRQAGLPSRVVVGYTHHNPGANGVFVVTTLDAHAWVEVYFPTIGWVPFDPTPLSGSDATRAVNLPWATHPNQTRESTDVPSSDVNRPSDAGSSSASQAVTKAATASSNALVPSLVWQIGLPVLGVLLVLLVLLVGPRLVRRTQRRRRLDRARSTGNPELLWLELAATATDRNALWPSTLTVGQVPDWLGRHGVDERGQLAVRSVAGTVERDRFSQQLVTKVPPEEIRALDLALTRWARRTDRRLSLMNRWLPKSLFGRSPRWHR